MRRFFSAITAVVIATAMMSLPNLAMAVPIQFEQLGDIQVNMPGQPLNNAQIGSLSAGTGQLLDINDGVPTIEISMDAYGVISSIDSIWDFNPFSLLLIDGNTWVFDIGKLESFSNNGNHIDGWIGYGVGLEIYAKTATAEAPEPSTLALLILALALLVIARQYKYVRLSRIPARS